MGKFKKGLFLGSLFGAGLMWLNATAKGKQTRKQILTHSEKIYNELHEKILSSATWKDMTKSKYVKMVKKQVTQYSQKYSLPPAVKNMIIKVVSAQWKNVKMAVKKKQ